MKFSQRSFQSKGGQAMLATAVLFLFISSTVTMGVITPIAHQIKSTENLLYSKASQYASESGIEDVSYRVKQNITVSAAEQIAVNGIVASTTIVTSGGDKTIVSVGSQNDAYRKNQATLRNGVGVAFHYGVQVGQGGISMSNSSTIEGNLFSNGPITASNSATVNGNVISAGPTGLIDGMDVVGSAYAHTIRDSTVSVDAYYQSISGTVVYGTSYPGSPDQATTSLPISDATIDGWEAAAQAGGVHTSPCSYNIWNSTVTIGPKKINCDLILSGSSVLNLTGPVWVVGNINISNSATIQIDPSLGSQSVALIADNPANRSSSSQIILSNSTTYNGSGDPNSYVLLVSRNNSAQNGGGNQAISISNSAQGDLLLYAPNGLITLSNSVHLREVTGYKTQVSNSAEVEYETGLENLLFSSGPGGGYQFSGWNEIQ